MRTKNKGVPAGMSRCSHCKQIKPADQFRELKTATDGLDSWCRECRRIGSNPQRRLLQYDLQMYKQTHGCRICGERDPRLLDFHHTDSGKKTLTVSEVGNHKPAEIWKEVESCVILCKTCHRNIHKAIRRKVVHRQKVERMVQP
jgi:hypothetical protein